MWKAAFSGRSETGSVSGRSTSSKKKSSGSSRKSEDENRRPGKSSRSSTYGDEDSPSTYATAPSSRVGEPRSLTESAVGLLNNDDGGWEDDDRDARSERKSVRSEGRKHRRRSEKERSRSRSRETTHSQRHRKSSHKGSEVSRRKSRDADGGDERAIPDMGSFEQFPGQYAGGAMGQSGRQEPMMSGALQNTPNNQFGLSRADSYGAAAEYYLDEGQSVTDQPGIRASTPNMLVNPDLHLIAPSAEAQPAQDTGHGSAADFYGGKVSPVLTTEPLPARPSKSSSTSKQSKPGRTPSFGNAAAATAAGVGFGAAAASSASSYYQSQNQTSTPTTSYQQSPSSSSKPASRPIRQSSEPVTSGSAGAYYAPPPQMGASSGSTGRQSSHTNTGLYAAGAAAAGAAAYGMSQHHGQHPSTPSASAYGGAAYSHPPSYHQQRHQHQHGASMNGNMQQQHFHEHKGPMTRLKDGLFNLISSEEDTIKMEMYTEYIGVCKHCFDPRSSPYDAPRRHHYHSPSRRGSIEDLRKRRSNERMRRSSREQLGRTGSTRVDKDSRYYSDRKKGASKTDLVGAGLATAGVVAGANALFNSDARNFDDTYSVRTGHRESSAVRRRSRSSSRERRRRTSYGVIGRESGDEYITVRGKDGRMEKRKVHRSRSRSGDRKSTLMGAAAGAALGASAMSAAGRSRRSRQHSPNGAFVRRRSGSRSSSGSSRQGGMFGGFFSPPHRKRRGSRPERRKKERGFFSFGNDSSASSDSELAFGATRSDLSLRRKPSTKSIGKRKKSDEHIAATVAGLGATAAALAAAQNGHRLGKRSSRMELGPGRDARKRQIARKQGKQATSDDEWEDELPSDADDASSGSDLAFGDFDRKLSRQGSKESMSSQSSGAGGLSAWGWRWGGKDKKDKRTKRRRVSPEPPAYPPRPGHPGYGDMATGIAAGAAAGAGLDAARRMSRPESTYTSGPSTPQQPMQYVDPRPISDAGSLPGSRHPSIPGDFDAPYTAAARPTISPVQPKPFTPIKPSFTQDTRDFDHDRPIPRRSQSSPVQQSSWGKDAALIGAAALGTAAVIASQGRKPKDVRFGLTEEQERRHEDERRKEQQRLDEERRRADRTRALKEEAERHTREQEVLRQRAEGNRRQAELELERQRAAQREAEQQAEIVRRQERERIGREERALRERREREAWEREEHERQLRESREREEAYIREQRRLADEKQREQREFAEQQRREHDRRTSERRQYEREEEEKAKSSSMPWGAMAAGAAAAGVGAYALNQHERNKDDEREARSTARESTREPYVAREVKPAGVLEKVESADDVLNDPEFFKRQRSRSPAEYARHVDELARKAADKVQSVNTVVAENDAYYAEPKQTQAEFFAPKEILSQPSEGKTKVADPIGDNSVQVYNAADDKMRKEFESSWGGTFADPRQHPPRGVPKLDLITPTPPPDSMQRKRRETSPLTRSQDVEPEVEGRGKTTRSRSISWGADQTHVYDVVTPDSIYERQSYMDNQHDYATPGVAAAGIVAAAAAGAALDEVVVEPASPSDEEGRRTYREEDFPSVPKPSPRPDDFDVSVEEVFDERDEPRFYAQPFHDSVPDIGGFGGFNVDSPGTEGAPPVRGFVEGETDEPTPALERAPHVPGGFDEEEAPSGSAIDVPAGEFGTAGESSWEPPLTKKEKKKREKAAKRSSTLDDVAAVEAGTPEVETAMETPAQPEEEGDYFMSKKDKNKRDKAAAMAAFATDFEPAGDGREVSAPPEDDSEMFLSKKDKKKREKAMKRTMSEDQTPPPATIEEPVAPFEEPAEVSRDVEEEPAWEPPLSKKDKKKREKEAKKQGFADVAEAVMTAGGVAAVASAVVDDSSESSSTPKKGKKGKKAKAVERNIRDIEPAESAFPESSVPESTEPSHMPGGWDNEGAEKEAETPAEPVDPFQYQMQDDYTTSTTPREADPFAEFADVKSSKKSKKKKRDSLKFNEPTVSSPLRSGMAVDDYIGEDVSGSAPTTTNGHDTAATEQPLEPTTTFAERTVQPSGYAVDEQALPPTDHRISPDDLRSVISEPAARKSSKNERSYYDEPESYDDTRSVAASEPVDTYESGRKSKRRSRHEDDDTASVVSSRSKREKEETPAKEKKSGFFGMFSRKSSDTVPRSEGAALSRTSTRDGKDDEADDGERKHRRRKHRSTSEYGDDDDTMSVVSSSSRKHRSRSEKDYGSQERDRSRASRYADDDLESRNGDGSHRHHRRRTEDENGERRESSGHRHHHRRRTDEYADDGKDQSFLGMRVEDLPPLPDSRRQSLDSAWQEDGQGHGNLVSAEPDSLTASRDFAGAVDASQPVDDEQERVEGPAIQEVHEDPKRLSWADEVEYLPALPESPPGSPTLYAEPDTPQRPSSLGRPTSTTAVPLRFPFGHQPVTPSPRMERAASFGGTIPSTPTTPSSAQKSRQNRPTSTEIRPLYLVERNRKIEEVEEMLPSLPSSKPSSRASSMVGSDEYLSAAEDWDSPQRRRALTIDTDQANEEWAEWQGEDYLDSQQTTPRATQSPEHYFEKPPRSEPQFYTWEDYAREEQMRNGGAAAPSDDGREEQPSTFSAASESEVEGYFPPQVPREDVIGGDELPALPPSRPGSRTDDRGTFDKVVGVAAAAAVGGAAALGYQALKPDEEREPTEEPPQREVAEPSEPVPDAFEEPSEAQPSVARSTSAKKKSKKESKKGKKGKKTIEEPKAAQPALAYQDPKEFLADDTLMEEGQASGRTEPQSEAPIHQPDGLDRSIAAEEQREEAATGEPTPSFEAAAVPTTARSKFEDQSQPTLDPATDQPQESQGQTKEVDSSEQSRDANDRTVDVVTAQSELLPLGDTAQSIPDDDVDEFMDAEERMEGGQPTVVEAEEPPPQDPSIPVETSDEQMPAVEREAEVAPTPPAEVPTPMGLPDLMSRKRSKKAKKQKAAPILTTNDQPGFEDESSTKTVAEDTPEEPGDLSTTVEAGIPQPTASEASTRDIVAIQEAPQVESHDQHVEPTPDLSSLTSTSPTTAHATFGSPSSSAAQRLSMNLEESTPAEAAATSQSAEAPVTTEETLQPSQPVPDEQTAGQPKQEDLWETRPSLSRKKSKKDKKKQQKEAKQSATVEDEPKPTEEVTTDVPEQSNEASLDTREVSEAALPGFDAGQDDLHARDTIAHESQPENVALPPSDDTDLDAEAEHELSAPVLGPAASIADVSDGALSGPPLDTPATREVDNSARQLDQVPEESTPASEATRTPEIINETIDRPPEEPTSPVDDSGTGLPLSDLKRGEVSGGDKDARPVLDDDAPTVVESAAPETAKEPLPASEEVSDTQQAEASVEEHHGDAGAARPDEEGPQSEALPSTATAEETPLVQSADPEPEAEPDFSWAPSSKKKGKKGKKSKGTAARDEEPTVVPGSTDPAAADDAKPPTEAVPEEVPQIDEPTTTSEVIPALDEPPATQEPEAEPEFEWAAPSKKKGKKGKKSKTGAALDGEPSVLPRSTDLVAADDSNAPTEPLAEEVSQANDPTFTTNEVVPALDQPLTSQDLGQEPEFDWTAPSKKKGKKGKKSKSVGFEPGSSEQLPQEPEQLQVADPDTTTTNNYIEPDRAFDEPSRPDTDGQTAPTEPLPAETAMPEPEIDWTSSKKKGKKGKKSKTVGYEAEPSEQLPQELESQVADPTATEVEAPSEQDRAIDDPVAAGIDEQAFSVDPLPIEEAVPEPEIEWTAPSKKKGKKGKKSKSTGFEAEPLEQLPQESELRVADSAASAADTSLDQDRAVDELGGTAVDEQPTSADTLPAAEAVPVPEPEIDWTPSSNKGKKAKKGKAAELEAQQSEPLSVEPGAAAPEFATETAEPSLADNLQTDQPSTTTVDEQIALETPLLGEEPESIEKSTSVIEPTPAEEPVLGPEQERESDRELVPEPDPEPEMDWAFTAKKKGKKGKKSKSLEVTEEPQMEMPGTTTVDDQTATDSPLPAEEPTTSRELEVPTPAEELVPEPEFDWTSSSKKKAKKGRKDKSLQVAEEPATAPLEESPSPVAADITTDATEPQPELGDPISTTLDTTTNAEEPTPAQETEPEFIWEPLSKKKGKKGKKNKTLDFTEDLPTPPANEVVQPATDVADTITENPREQSLQVDGPAPADGPPPTEEAEADVTFSSASKKKGKKGKKTPSFVMPEEPPALPEDDFPPSVEEPQATTEEPPVTTSEQLAPDDTDATDTAMETPREQDVQPDDSMGTEADVTATADEPMPAQEADPEFTWAAAPKKKGKKGKKSKEAALPEEPVVPREVSLPPATPSETPDAPDPFLETEQAELKPDVDDLWSALPSSKKKKGKKAKTGAFQWTPTEEEREPSSEPSNQMEEALERDGTSAADIPEPQILDVMPPEEHTSQGGEVVPDDEPQQDTMALDKDSGATDPASSAEPALVTEQLAEDSRDVGAIVQDASETSPTMAMDLSDVSGPADADVATRAPEAAEATLETTLNEKEVPGYAGPHEHYGSAERLDEVQDNAVTTEEPGNDAPATPTAVPVESEQLAEPRETTSPGPQEPKPTEEDETESFWGFTSSKKKGKKGKRSKQVPEREVQPEALETNQVEDQPQVDLVSEPTADNIVTTLDEPQAAVEADANDIWTSSSKSKKSKKGKKSASARQSLPSSQPRDVEPEEPEVAGADPAEFETTEVKPTNVEPSEIATAEPETAEVDKPDVEPAEVNLAELESMAIDPVEAGLTTAGANEAEHADAQPAEATPMNTEPIEVESLHAEPTKGESTEVQPATDEPEDIWQAPVKGKKGKKNKKSTTTPEAVERDVVHDSTYYEPTTVATADAATNLSQPTPADEPADFWPAPSKGKKGKKGKKSASLQLPTESEDADNVASKDVPRGSGADAIAEFPESATAEPADIWSAPTKVKKGKKAKKNKWSTFDTPGTDEPGGGEENRDAAALPGDAKAAGDTEVERTIAEPEDVPLPDDTSAGELLPPLPESPAHNEFQALELADGIHQVDQSNAFDSISHDRSLDEDSRLIDSGSEHLREPAIEDSPRHAEDEQMPEASDVPPKAAEDASAPLPPVPVGPTEPADALSVPLPVEADMELDENTEGSAFEAPVPDAAPAMATPIVQDEQALVPPTDDQRDVDFTNDVAGALADSGFNPADFADQPIFQRRTSPPAMVGEADPEEVFTTSNKKKKKGKKGKREMAATESDAIETTPAAAETREINAPEDRSATQPADDINETIQKALASTGFDSALLQEATTSSQEAPINELAGDGDYNFTTSKRKKGKKSKKSTPPQFEMVTPRADQFEGDQDASDSVTAPGMSQPVADDQRVPPADADPMPASRSVDGAETIPDETTDNLYTAAQETTDLPSQDTMPQPAAETTEATSQFEVGGYHEMDLEEMDKAYKMFKKNKKKKKQKATALEPQDEPSSAFEEPNSAPRVEQNDQGQLGNADTAKAQDSVRSDTFADQAQAPREVDTFSAKAERGRSPAETTSNEEPAASPKDVAGGLLGYVKAAATGLSTAAAAAAGLHHVSQDEPDTEKELGRSRDVSRGHSHQDAQPWSFANLEGPGEPLPESPSLGQKAHEIARDSGYQEASSPLKQRHSLDRTSRDTPSIRATASHESLSSRRSAEPLRISTDNTAFDWDLNVPKKRDNATDELSQGGLHARTPSQGTDNTPLESTTKNRASYLFQATPDTLRDLPASGSPTPSGRAPSAEYFDSTMPKTPMESQSLEVESYSREPDRTISSPPPSGTMSPRIPLDTIPEELHAHKRTLAETGLAQPDSIKSTRRTQTPQTIRARERALSPTAAPPLTTPSGGSRAVGNPLSTDEVIHNMPWPAIDEDGGNVGIDRSLAHKRSRQASLDHRPTSVMSNRSNKSASQMRTPEELRSYSRTSNRSSTPTLRRISLSGDLRAASRRGDSGSAVGARSSPRTIPFEAPPTPPSNDDEVMDGGASRSVDMSDVYQGVGDAHASQVSPTRPPSMRKRQSMHIMELESRLNQLSAENQLLHESGRGMPDEPDALRSRDLQLQEKEHEISRFKTMLQPLQEEIARLNDLNAGLTQANRDLVDEGNERYLQLDQERMHAQEQWQNTNRELVTVQQEHGRLNEGMKDIVEAEVADRLMDKDAEIQQLREELDIASEKIRALQMQVQATRGDSGFPYRDEDYFDGACQKLCQHVQQWVLRFSKSSDKLKCRKTSELNDEPLETRLDNVILDGSDVDVLLKERIPRRDVFMSLVMTMVWEYVFTRYLFGLDRENRQRLKQLDKLLTEAGPPKAVAQWKATTLTLLSRRPAFAEQKARDLEAVVLDIWDKLCALLPPPSSAKENLLESLFKVVGIAADLSIEMRIQRAEYIMLPPLQPEYDTNGDLVRQVHFNASLMNERSGMFSSNEELEESQAVVKLVLFPLVVKKGDESGEGEEEIVVCPAQVLVQSDNYRGKRVVRVQSGAIPMEIDDPRRSRQSLISAQGSMPF
ncbi:uncharacterized protein LTR77_006253 [Saxophila tyrrhenica]|uniref:Involucrin repeat protein n=1 Tax=Saxophila tyrrhenica TaxID=1690608 RepID=A0AAV9P7E1_9PEZI|nr:hypothetical protein LTR77_006253 [Saxophila tyrrhenica]